MKDYIDREYAIASLDRLKMRNARNNCVLSANEDAIKKWLEALFPADVVEIVRCKDCKYWNGETHGCTRNPSVEAWFESDYCSYGERKDA